MNVAIFSPLDERDEWLSTFIGPLTEMGHRVVLDLKFADVAFLSLRWGRQDYDHDRLNAAIEWRIPFVAFDFMDYSVFTGGSEWFEWGLSPNFCNLARHDTYSTMPWAFALRAVDKAGLLRVYFMRYVQKSQTYPKWVRPIEQAMYEGFDFPLDKDVCERPYDLCFVGMAAQCRATLLCHLIESRLFKIDWEWPFVRMDKTPWVERHRRAKMFMEMNSGGQGSDRPYQLIRVAPMLKQRSDRLWVHNWVDGVNCLDIADVRGIPQPGDLDKLRRLLDDKDKLQAIYETGAAWAEARFSRYARTEYVLGVLRDFGIN